MVKIKLQKGEISTKKSGQRKGVKQSVTQKKDTVNGKILKDCQTMTMMKPKK